MSTAATRGGVAAIVISATASDVLRRRWVAALFVAGGVALPAS